MRSIDILLVEDNEGDILLTTEAFEESKIANILKVLTDGRAAVDFFENLDINGNVPDLILLDVNLPKMSGHEVLVYLKNNEKYKHIPVIMLTTSSADADILKSYRNHVNCYITKPIEVSDFMEAVTKIEDFWINIVSIPKNKCMPIDKREYRILIVEDNPGDYALIEDFLFEQIWAPVLFNAVNFKEAQMVLTSMACQLDVVLLDLSLPDKTGAPLIHEIQAICNNVPIIVLTGYSDIAFGLKSLSLGISDYLLKDELTAISLYKSILYSAERKRNLLALEESEKRYSNLFHLSPLPMWVTDLHSLKFLDVNQAAIQHYGFSREEFFSMTLKDIRPENEIPYLMKTVNDALKNETLTSHFYAVHRLKSGELRDVELQVARIEFNGITANMIISSDITERSNYIKEIENQNEKLREISWIQSHVVRAPLARIMGLLSILDTMEIKEPPLKQVLEYMAISSHELDNVIRNITDKTRVADFEPNNKRVIR